MPWTESRSRDEWLAEVTRRGERIRRRRRAAFSGLAGAALLAPALAVASLTVGNDAEPQFQVAAGGPVSTAGTGGLPVPTVFGGEVVLTTTTLAAAETGGGQSIAPAAPSVTTTTEVHRRVSSINGSASPAPGGDPVIRPSPTTTLASYGDDGVQSSPPLSPTPNATLPQNDPNLSACPVSDVRVTVSIEQPSYAPGETVRWSSTLENRSTTTCLVSGRAFFSVEDPAGRTVGSFAYTANYMLPVKAEPGKKITNSGSWDQKDCSSACVQVPAGTYVVVAGWTEGGQYYGRGSFQIRG